MRTKDFKLGQVGPTGGHLVDCWTVADRIYVDRRAKNEETNDE